MEEIRGGWRRLNTEEINNLYSLPDIIRIVRSKRMILAGQVASV
jgi:hypothetical protein